jgi:putative phage-type endonuclease
MTPEQWEARRGLVTASRIAKIAGVSRFGGPASAWLEMTENKMSEEETDAQRRGRILEPSILDWYREQVPGWAVVPCGSITRDDIPFAAATPDSLAIRDDLRRSVEAKSAAGPVVQQFGEEGTDEIPAEYLCQTQWQMGIGRLERADVPVLLSDPFAGFCFRLYTVHFDEALFGHLVEMAAKFHRDHIVTGKPPPADNPDQAQELLARLHPRANEDVVPATPEIDSLGLQLGAIREEAKALKSKKDALTASIKAFLGDRRTVTGTGWKALWTNVKGQSVTDWEAIARELGATEEMVQRHTSLTAGHRQFRPYFKDEI